MQTSAFWRVLPFVVCGVLLLTLAALSNGILLLIVLMFIGATLLGGLLFYINNNTIFISPYDRAERVVRQANHRYIADFNQTIKKLHTIREKYCRTNSMAESLVMLQIIIVESRRDSAIRQGMAYAAPADLLAARQQLGLEKVHPLTPADIKTAANDIRHRHDIAMLKKRKAPKGLLKTAQQRIDAATAAEELLLGAPKGHII